MTACCGALALAWTAAVPPWAQLPDARVLASQVAKRLNGQIHSLEKRIYLHSPASLACKVRTMQWPEVQ